MQIQNNNIDSNEKEKPASNAFMNEFFGKPPTKDEQMTWRNSNEGFVTSLKFNND